MTAIVLRGDARRLPLPDASVDLIVTSVPYWGLRDYTDDGESLDGQIGSEETPQEWLANLMDCTAEWARVLKPSGSMFVNCGDKFAAGHGGSSTEGNGVTIRKRSTFAANPRERPDLPDPPASWSTRDVTGRNVVPGFRPKSLMGLPWRYALACTDQLGLILRRDIIWAKPNGLPESVTDRCRSSHEYLFHLTLQPRYYAAVDEIREPQIHDARKVSSSREPRDERLPEGARKWNVAARDLAWNPLGKLPGSVWSIPSQPLTVPPHLGVDHFAAYPVELPRRCVLGWSPPGICTSCGEGRRPVVDKHEPVNAGRHRPGYQMPRTSPDSKHGTGASSLGYGSVTSIAGYACACTPSTDHPGTGERDTGDQVKWSPDGQTPRQRQVGGHLGNAPRVGPQREYHFEGWTPPPTRPAVVLDPFSGTGTTLLAASALGRVGIGVDLSADYCRLARWRVSDPGERAKAMQVPKPPPIPDGMEALF